MKVFEDQTEGIEAGQKAVDFHIDDDLYLADLAGFVLFLVFWKSL